MQAVQGDLLFVSVNEAPKSWGEPKKEGKVTKDKNGSLVIARGSATGNSHVVRSKGSCLYQINERLFVLVLKNKGILDHQEHKPEIKLPAGEYFIRKQREFTPDQIRTVQD